MWLTCKGSFSSVEPIISWISSWRSSGLPNVKHFSTTLEANFCWLILTIWPSSLLIIADRSWGFPCSSTCYKKQAAKFNIKLMNLISQSKRHSTQCGNTIWPSLNCTFFCFHGKPALVMIKPSQKLQMLGKEPIPIWHVWYNGLKRTGMESV